MTERGSYLHFYFYMLNVTPQIYLVLDALKYLYICMLETRLVFIKVAL